VNCKGCGNSAIRSKLEFDKCNNNSNVSRNSNNKTANANKESSNNVNNNDPKATQGKILAEEEAVGVAEVNDGLLRCGCVFTGTH